MHENSCGYPPEQAAKVVWNGVQFGRIGVSNLFPIQKASHFLFLCGIMGHDDHHCQLGVNNRNEPQQYGEWL